MANQKPTEDELLNSVLADAEETQRQSSQHAAAQTPQDEPQTDEITQEMFLQRQQQEIDAFVDDVVSEAAGEESDGEIHEEDEPAEPARVSINDITGAKLKLSTYNGKEDHKAFYIYAMTRKYPLATVIFLAVELGLSIWFAFSGGNFVLLQVLLYFTLFIAADTAYILLRTRNLLRVMEKRNALALQSVRLDIAFMPEEIVIIKKGIDVRVPYTRMKKYSESKERVFLYFDNTKALLIRKDDLNKDQLKTLRQLCQQALNR